MTDYDRYFSVAPTMESLQATSIQPELTKNPAFAEDLGRFMQLSRMVLQTQIVAEMAPHDKSLLYTLPPLAFDSDTAAVEPIQKTGIGVQIYGSLDDPRHQIGVYGDEVAEDTIMNLEEFQETTDLPTEWNNIFKIHNIISSGELRHFGFDSSYTYVSPDEPIPDLPSPHPDLMNPDILMTRSFMTATIFAAIRQDEEYRDILPEAMKQYELLRRAGNRPFGPEELCGFAASAVELFFATYESYKRTRQFQQDEGVESA